MCLGLLLPRVEAFANSGLPLPRFVSLRSDRVNLRTGPGVQYPVEWTYLRRGLPVEVIAEFDAWRRIRDWEGAEGWVHQSMIAGRRALVVIGSVRSLRRKEGDDTPPVALVEPGVIGELLECPKDSQFCRVGVASQVGWLRRSEFWGVHRGEYIN